ASTGRTPPSCEPSPDLGTCASRSPQNPSDGPPSTPTNVRSTWRLSLHSPTEIGGAPLKRRPSVDVELVAAEGHDEGLVLAGVLVGTGVLQGQGSARRRVGVDSGGEVGVDRRRLDQGEVSGRAAKARRIPVGAGEGEGDRGDVLLRRGAVIDREVNRLGNAARNETGNAANLSDGHA